MFFVFESLILVPSALFESPHLVLDNVYTSSLNLLFHHHVLILNSTVQVKDLEDAPTRRVCSGWDIRFPKRRRQQGREDQRGCSISS